jgi:GTP-binding protein
MAQRDMLQRHLPIVAIVGRPNVGKSTLFNRLTGRRKAVVLDTPGVTRDRNYHVAEWNGTRMLVVDTGGYESEPTHALSAAMREQTLLAIDEADVIIHVVAADEPLNPTDHDILELLRKAHKPVFIAVNKCDNESIKQAALADFASFGMEIFPISALHGLRTAELLDRVTEALPRLSE